MKVISTMMDEPIYLPFRAGVLLRLPLINPGLRQHQRNVVGCTFWHRHRLFGFPCKCVRLPKMSVKPTPPPQVLAGIIVSLLYHRALFHLELIIQTPWGKL